MDKGENRPQLEPISIIIPCLNEEQYIGTLLSRLARQTFQQFEVLIVDGFSEDATRAAVEHATALYPALWGKVRFVASDTKGVASQRNFGAREAHYERLLFLDADVQLPDSFLEITLEEIEKHRLDVATAIFEPISERVDDKFFYYMGNIYIQLQQYVHPVAMGFCIFSTKSVHRALGGFDETMKISEDFDYVRRAAKLDVRFKVLTKDRIYASVRRLKKEGRFTYYRKAVLSEMLNLFMDKEKIANAIEYDFGNYDQTSK